MLNDVTVQNRRPKKRQEHTGGGAFRLMLVNIRERKSFQIYMWFISYFVETARLAYFFCNNSYLCMLISCRAPYRLVGLVI